MPNPLLNSKTGQPLPSKKKDLSHLQVIAIHHGAAGTERWTAHDFINHRHSSALDWKKENPGSELFAYSGLAYNWVIFPDGSFIYDVPVEEVAWSVGGFNSFSISICFAGDFTGKLPTEAALKTAEQIIAAQYKRFGSHLTLIGHRDAVKYSKQATPTACPGNTLYGYLPTLDKRARAYVK